MKKTIIVVDDEPHISNLIKLSMDKDKFNVIEAYSPHKALELLKNTKVDLITVDIMMPGMDGYTLIKEISKICPDTPTIIISAKNNMKDKIHGINTGALDFIEKPFDPQDLSDRILQVLNEG
ncbi:response regulator [Candidatus Woesearchaeota archaeon]|nr:response regulator [Candidatus Woesearchaeota archaeon]